MTALVLQPGDKLMVLAVHPDDESIGTGGLIQQAMAMGAKVRVVWMTDGDNNPWPQRFVEKRWGIGRNDRLRWGRIRREEALAALAVLGLKPEDAAFMGLPDQGITSLLMSNDIEPLKRIKQEILSWQPSLLAVPSADDLHPDHNASAVLIDLLLSDDEIKRPRLLAYLVHGDLSRIETAVCVALPPVQQLLKRVAILCHASQMQLSRHRFLRHVRPFEQFHDHAASDDRLPMSPITDVRCGEGMLYVSLKLTLFQRWMTNPMLYIVAGNARLALMLKSPAQAEGAELFDYTSGKVVGQASLAVKAAGVRLGIPLKHLPSPQHLYLKVLGSIGFFDKFGWRRLTLKPSVEKERAVTVAIIPCFNVADYCEPVIVKACEFADRLIVIDDGSTDGTAEIIARLVERMPGRIVPITFSANQGKGVGLMTGFRAAIERFDFDCLLTLDADGQHPPSCMPELVKAVEAGAAMVIGEREIRLMPGRSRVGNTLVSGLLRWCYPSAPIDTQSGMRAFNYAWAAEIAKTVRGSRYETEFQVLLLALSRRQSITSVTIPTVYLDNNRSSKFRPIADSMRILATLILWRLGFGPKAA